MDARHPFMRAVLQWMQWIDIQARLTLDRGALLVTAGRLGITCGRWVVRCRRGPGEEYCGVIAAASHTC
jgi:hypothetical protein